MKMTRGRDGIEREQLTVDVMSALQTSQTYLTPPSPPRAAVFFLITPMFGGGGAGNQLLETMCWWEAGGARQSALPVRGNPAREEGIIGGSIGIKMASFESARRGEQDATRRWMERRGCDAAADGR